MIVLSLVSTKGGVGKTTVAANLGGLSADAGLRCLLVDLDPQPTLSSYFPIASRAPAGVYEWLATNECNMARLVSRTSINNLDLILSNDDRGQLNTLLLHAADGRLRLRNLLPALYSHYDLMIIDTQGARSVLLEAALLASDVAVSPVVPEVLAARELQRGTLQLVRDLAPFRRLGITPPVLQLLINHVPAVSSNARLVQDTLRQVFCGNADVNVLHTRIPGIETYRRAAALAMPVHRLEYRKPNGRVAPAALDTMKSLASELLPQWHSMLSSISDSSHRRRGNVRA